MAQIDRTEKNRQYQAMGESFIADQGAWGRLHPLQNARGCLEQLGRMIDTAENATILEKAEIAADALTAGRTVKQVEAYLRHGRTAGEWDESLLTATKENATKAAKPVEGLTPADLIAIEALLRDSMTLYDILGEADRKSKPRERRNARMAEMYADKVKTAYEIITGRTFPQTTGDTAQ